MNLQKAFQRLSWRLSSGKFDPNQNDIDALKFIAGWVNREKEERVNQNRYFGKMLIYTLMREADHFGDTRFAERKLHDILEKPLEYWYDRYRLRQVMNDFQQTKDITGVEGFSEIWDRHKGENGYFDMGKIKPEVAANNTLMAENKEILTTALTRWEQTEINKALNNLISELLNEYGNKP